VHEWQSWFRYYNQVQLNEKLILHTELDERRKLKPWSQAQFFAHVHLHYRVKPWLEVAGGMNFNTTNVITAHHSLEVPEWRPWQEISLVKKLGTQTLFQVRYRLDERFIHKNNKEVLLDGYHFNWRHRFRIQFSKPIAEIGHQHTLTLKISDEVMLNTGDVIRTFDQNRLSTSLELSLSKHWSIETGYLNLIQQVGDARFLERHVIRTTAYHHIGIP
jgi:hypothetical protein